MRTSRGPRELYFIGDDLGQFVKIGISSNPGFRLHDLQAGCPLPLRLDLVLNFSGPGAEVLEDALHQHFAAYWIHREWFTYADCIKDYVAAWHAGEQPEIPSPPHRCNQAYGPHGEALKKSEYLAILQSERRAA